MKDFKLAVKRDGCLLFDNIETGFTIENGSITRDSFWYMNRRNHASRQFAMFSTKTRVLDACRVFIEGATKQADESDMDMVKRALQSCLETGSTSTMKLAK